MIRWRLQDRLCCNSVTVALPPLLRPSDLFASRCIFIAILYVTVSGPSRNSLLSLYGFVCYRRARRCESRVGGTCLRSLHTAITAVSLRMPPLFTIRCAQMLYTGVLWFFRSRFAADILGLRVSPLAVVLAPKFHDLTFACAGGRTSATDDADFYSAPPCELGHVLRDFLLRVFFLRQRHGSTARILLCRVDVKDAKRCTTTFHHTGIVDIPVSVSAPTHQRLRCLLLFPVGKVWGRGGW